MQVQIQPATEQSTQSFRAGTYRKRSCKNAANAAVRAKINVQARIHGRGCRKPASPAATAVDVSEYTVGRKVEHSKFGTGVIVSVSGSGNETIAGIEFENLGIKKFVVALAAKNMRLL